MRRATPGALVGPVILTADHGDAPITSLADLARARGASSFDEVMT